ncbi:MAG: 50S ribosomal protein L18 [Elusimicrobia bacterium RIFCSPLOWO2_12_FULL_59_9]|nr:MAG: 50S ribosomal protein L18 [Elusimicrobia bacterium RIFCSPLOWO2_12_FULL_59_9]
MPKSSKERYQFRRARVKRILGRQLEWPRLSVYRSLRHLYAQVIDDKEGKTLAFASSLSKEIKARLKSGKNKDAAKLVGELVAKQALGAGVKRVRFDRGGRLYHGRLAALADAARKEGLEF